MHPKHLFKVFLLSIFFCWALIASAQKVYFQEPEDLRQMMQNWTDANRTQAGIDGWRVQVMASTDRAQIESAKDRFLNLYPDVPADWIHERPYFKLHVGAFRTRLEASAFVDRIQENFPGSYPARDSKIDPKDFLMMRR